MELSLPFEIVSQADVARMQREVKSLDDFFVQSKARQPGSPIQPPKVTRLLEKTAQDNGYNLLNEQHRQKLADQLDQVIAKAPFLHISFASDPSPKAVEKILSWFRSNIHPQTLLQVGLQPTVAAGCVLRTPNKVIDMSMRNYLKKQEDFMVQLINTATKKD